MRNPNRIGRFVIEVGIIWKKYFPDWRFGQLMYNFFAAYGDPFYWEEDKFLENLREYAKNNSKWHKGE